MDLTVQNVAKLEINDFLGGKLQCECKKPHSIAMERILIEDGAIQKLPALLKELGLEKALVIADTNTDQVAGAVVETALTDAKFSYKKFVFKVKDDLVPNEEAVGTLLIQVQDDIDVIVTIGTGTLNDLAKFVGYRIGIPTIIVATAPSMDGFASTGAALIVDNLKTSFECACPTAIIGDVSILKEAPLEMIVAGFGDILGKYSALTDWKLATAINGEYYCPVVAKMVTDSMEKCIANMAGFKQKDELAIQHLMEALVLTGIAMSFVGNSRPASGAEHHLAHYWEMMFLFEGKKAVLHGTKVGITTSITAKLSQLLADAGTTIDFEQAIAKAKAFDQEQWKESVQKLYQKAAGEIIKINEKEDRNSITKQLARLEIIQAKLPEIIKILQDVPAPEKITELLQQAGGVVYPSQVGINDETVLHGILMAKEVRTRYTLLNLLSDVGLLHDFAHEVTGNLQGV